MLNAKELILMDIEWQAWGKVVYLWHNKINQPKNKPVINAINKWGETLVNLRAFQLELSNRT